MLNQERIILMTKMASYEENEGKKNNAIMNYFRGDYVWLQVMKSFVCGMDIYKMDLMEFGKSVLMKYLLVIGIYSIISYAIYCYRYAKAKNGVKLYMNNLRRLAGMYDKT